MTFAAFYLLLGGVTFLAYACDKFFAQRDSWRIPEAMLHLMSLLGGWPGAWLAQRLLRHKSRKVSFRIVYWLTVVGHLGAFGLWRALA